MSAVETLPTVGQAEAWREYLETCQAAPTCVPGASKTSEKIEEFAWQRLQERLKTA
jgi:hypothetical protein